MISTLKRAIRSCSPPALKRWLGLNEGLTFTHDRTHLCTREITVPNKIDYHIAPFRMVYEDGSVRSVDVSGTYPDHNSLVFTILDKEVVEIHVPAGLKISLMEADNLKRLYLPEHPVQKTEVHCHVSVNVINLDEAMRSNPSNFLKCDDGRDRYKINWENMNSFKLNQSVDVYRFHPTYLIGAIK